MTTRTKRLGYIVSGVLETYQTVYTVPAGKCAIVKSIRARNGSGVTTRIYGRVLLPNADAVTVFDVSGVAQATVVVINDFLVLMAGDKLQVVGVAAGVAWYVSGAELTAPV